MVARSMVDGYRHFKTGRKFPCSVPFSSLFLSRRPRAQVHLMRRYVLPNFANHILTVWSLGNEDTCADDQARKPLRSQSPLSSCTSEPADFAYQYVAQPVQLLDL